METKYLDLMECALSAYTDSRIQTYFENVKRDGLTEHGFPRLVSDIGILIAHGRCLDLMSLFLEMMEFCCKAIPTVKAANDFSVREIVCCIGEIEKSGRVDKATVDTWKGHLATIDPTTCYNFFAQQPTDKVKNWALFTGVSEFFRWRSGIGGSEEFIETQIASQLQWLDENGMYMDGSGEIRHPVVYDLVPRGLIALLLNAGYRGRYYNELDGALRRAGLASLQMQSPNGEVPFGGRSNQFVFNEAWLIAIFEYEARRYFKEKNFALAEKFKAASQRALAVTQYWLSLRPIYHIKNRFPTETKYGCEGYAYFDKYMITVASNLYAASLICDSSIPFQPTPDHQPTVFATSHHFHKFFMKAGGYGLEFDLNADMQYDAAGLGRLHKEGAPSAICLSMPCLKGKGYLVDIEPSALSLCPGILKDGKWELAADSETKYEVSNAVCDEASAYATVRSLFLCGREVVCDYTVNKGGVTVQIAGDGDVAYALPALCFDGEARPEITLLENVLTVSYLGYVCRYTVSGKIMDGEKLAANRNGHYKTFMAVDKNRLTVQIEIIKS